MGNFVSDWLAGWRLEILCCVIVECRMFANRIGSTCLVKDGRDTAINAAQIDTVEGFFKCGF